MEQLVGLAITTSSPRGGAAVWGGGESLAAFHYLDERMHAERIVQVVDDVISQSGISRSELAWIACDVGPGSFTSLRIGMATALGIAEALLLPTIGVTSLEAMASGGFVSLSDPTNTELLCVVDGKRGEFFAGSFVRSSSGHVGPGSVVPQAVAKAMLPQLVAELANSSSASRLCCASALLAECPDLAHHRIVGAPAELPDANEVARLAAQRYGVAGSAEHGLSAVYLRGADAKMQKRRPCLVDASDG